MLLVLSNKGKGMQSSGGRPLVGEGRCVATWMMAAKETSRPAGRPRIYLRSPEAKC